MNRLMSILKKRVLRPLKKIGLNIAIVCLVVINLLLGYSLWKNWGNQSTASNYPEIAILEKKDMNLAKLQEFFQNISETKGAVYAYNLLKIAPIADNIDMHLLAHSVGEELYKQRGLEGMLDCDHSFRNACSHSVVIGEFEKDGEKSLEKIHEVCKKAPGGKGAYDMCYHGLGHGVFAYTGYDLPAAVKICSQNEAYKITGREYLECVGGIIMELVGGGDHDKALFKEQKVKYLSPTDPLSPCDTDLIPDKVKSICYVYITPHIFEATGAKSNNPSNESLKKAFRYCDRISQNESGNRSICYIGFGKEFVVMAKNKDIRSLSEITPEQRQKAIDWCMLAENAFGVQECLRGEMGALYWGGDNPVGPVVDFCKALPKTELVNDCLQRLTATVKVYAKTDTDFRSYCGLLPAEQKSACDAQVK